jgi:hypothetical protein
MTRTAHLTADELVDLAEGARDANAFPHITACEACRRQVADLRTAIEMATAAHDVPEPSPLFWDHFSDRVRTAIATEPTPSSAWWRPSWVMATCVALAAALLVVVLIPSHDRGPARREPPGTITTAAAEPLGDLDDSLMIVADLTSSIDFDDARAAGLTGRGAAEHAVAHMSAGELRELRTLLAEQMNP